MPEHAPYGQQSSEPLTDPFTETAMRKIALAIAALLGAILALDLATAIYVANMLRIG